MPAQNLANTKNDLIIALVQRELRERVNLLPTVEDYSQFAIKGAKSVNVPKLSSFTVNDRAFGAADVEQTLTDSVDAIALDKNKIVSFIVDKADEVQSSMDYMLQSITYATQAHARQVDADIISVLTAGASLNINGGTPADISVANILAMREHLIGNNADMSMAAMVIGPDQERAMLSLAEFSRFEYRGTSPAPVVNGQIGSVYGVPVIINNQVAAQQAFMYERMGVGIAFQRQPNVGSQPKLEYGSEAELVVVDQLYGVDALQKGKNGAGATESPLIAKLAN